jgi:co-chaperonin GroES (HSP10)
MPVNYEPIGNKVLLKVIEHDTRSQSKIVLPQGVKTSDLLLAEVVAVGPGYLMNDGHYVPTQCKVGDEVYALSWLDVEFNGFKYVMAAEADILVKKNRE